MQLCAPYSRTLTPTGKPDDRLNPKFLFELSGSLLFEPDLVLAFRCAGDFHELVSLPDFGALALDLTLEPADQTVIRA